MNLHQWIITIAVSFLVVYSTCLSKKPETFPPAQNKIVYQETDYGVLRMEKLGEFRGANLYLPLYISESDFTEKIGDLQRETFGLMEWLKEEMPMMNGVQVKDAKWRKDEK